MKKSKLFFPENLDSASRFRHKSPGKSPMIQRIHAYVRLKKNQKKKIKKKHATGKYALSLFLDKLTDKFVLREPLNLKRLSGVFDNIRPLKS